MTNGVSTALAPEFDWEIGDGSASVIFASGTSPVAVTFPTGTYRQVLAPVGVDAVRLLASRINAACVAAGRMTDSFQVIVDELGVVSLANGNSFRVEWSGGLGSLFGFTEDEASNASLITAQYQPKHLYLFVGGDSADWTPTHPQASARTIAGRVASVLSGVVTWRDEIALEFIPRDPAYRAELEESATPWEPAPADLDALGDHDPPWSVSDLLVTAPGRTCALTRQWAAVRASTTERYDLVTLDPKDLREPRARQMVPGWPAYKSWPLGVVRLASNPTGTRA